MNSIQKTGRSHRVRYPYCSVWRAILPSRDPSDRETGRVRGCTREEAGFPVRGSRHSSQTCTSAVRHRRPKPPNGERVRWASSPKSKDQRQATRVSPTRLQSAFPRPRNGRKGIANFYRIPIRTAVQPRRANGLKISATVRPSLNVLNVRHKILCWN